MPVGDDTVQTDLVQVRSLELQHFVDARAVDLVRSILDLLLSTVGPAESGVDELLAVLVEQVERWQMSAARDLDQLCEAVPDLCLGQRPEETEVEEGVDWSVVRAQAVLVVTVVDRNLDGDGRVNQTDDSRGDADEVGVAAVRGASEAVCRLAQVKMKTGLIR